MTRARTLVVLAAIFCFALPALPAEAQASPTQDMVNRINGKRAAHGLAPLRLSSSLTRSSQAYSSRMMRTGYFGHQSRIQASRRFHRLGEVLEYRRGYRAAVASTLRDWLNSPGHRAVIMSASFKYIGAGLTRGHFHGRRATIWAAQLGR
jgi:uncharacterized protein YkwD